MQGALHPSTGGSLNAPVGAHRTASRARRVTQRSRSDPRPRPDVGRWMPPEVYHLASERRSRFSCRATGPSDAGKNGPYVDKPLFGASEKGSCSLREALEARDACSHITDPHQRKECYTSFGVDANRVESYLDSVMDMESKLPKAPSILEMASKLGGKLIMAFGLMCLVVLELLWNVAVSLYRGAEAMLNLARFLVSSISRLCKRLAIALSTNQDNCDAGGCYIFDAEHQSFREAPLNAGGQKNKSRVEGSHK